LYSNFTLKFVNPSPTAQAFGAPKCIGCQGLLVHCRYPQSSTCENSILITEVLISP